MRINGLGPNGGTSLWRGIVEAISVFNADQINTGRVPAIMILTDGEPNDGLVFTNFIGLFIEHKSQVRHC